MATIADQGRVLAGGSPLGSSAILTDIYNLAQLNYAGDFHDITSGFNGFPAGPGYDLVTGLGSPKPNLIYDLSAYGLASETTIVTQPPPTVVQNAPFGLVAEATDSIGIPDPAYSGTATLTLASGPSGATFPPITIPVSGAPAVFAGLTLGTLSNGTDYQFQVSMSGLT